MSIPNNVSLVLRGSNFLALESLLYLSSSDTSRTISQEVITVAIWIGSVVSSLIIFIIILIVIFVIISSTYQGLQQL